MVEGVLRFLRKFIFFFSLTYFHFLFGIAFIDLSDLFNLVLHSWMSEAINNKLMVTLQASFSTFGKIAGVKFDRHGFFFGLSFDNKFLSSETGHLCI